MLEVEPWEYTVIPFSRHDFSLCRKSRDLRALQIEKRMSSHRQPEAALKRRLGEIPELKSGEGGY
jgi:hypothetical protein